MEIEYHMNIITMWEFAMDGGRYDAPDFRNRHLTLPALDDSSIQPESLLSHTALQINATINCISAAHAILDTFLRFPVLALQRSTSIVYVRAMYALIALLKADYAVGTDPEGMGAVLDSESLGVEKYLDELVTKIGMAVGEQKCRIPAHWLMVINKKLKTWHVEHMQWRGNGGHLKVRKANMEKKKGTDTPAHMPHGKVVEPGTAHSTSQVLLSDQRPTQPQAAPDLFARSAQQQPLPSFTLPADYEWPNTTFPTQMNHGATAPDPPAAAATTSFSAPNPNVGPAPYDLDMIDFTTAFQNGGDLYLWNDMTEAYGGWIPNADGGTSLYDVAQSGGSATGL